MTACICFIYTHMCFMYVYMHIRTFIFWHGMFLDYIKVHDRGFPGDLVVKNPCANAGDMGLIPDSGGSRKPQGICGLEPRSRNS